jgi:hypothetical protein
MGQQQRVKRALFVNQVLVPIALGLLGHYENVDSRRPVPPRHFKMEELLGSELMPSKAILGYLEEAVRRDGGEDFSLKTVNFTMDADQMAGAVLASGAKGVIEDLCDVVRSYDCDLLLLSGRPSRLPAIHDLIISNLAVTPNRVVPMDTYEVGNWYPFRGSDFRIQDPKTTVVVGAMLCHICEGLQEGFNMRASEIRMRSTARYVGVMNINDQILDENVLLENVDLDTGQGLVQFDVHMEKPFFIGYRQLPLERWKTTPLYHVEFRNPERVPNLKLPLTVTFERATPRNEDDEEVMEDFRISDAMDAERAPCRNEVQVRLQTMRVNSHSGGGYWLDTGILRTGGRL